MQEGDKDRHLCSDVSLLVLGDKRDKLWRCHRRMRRWLLQGVMVVLRMRDDVRMRMRRGCEHDGMMMRCLDGLVDELVMTLVMKQRKGNEEMMRRC